jgi:hypothetical protein
MPKSAAITILLITRDRLVRGDLARGAVAGVWAQPRPDLPDLPSLAEAALRLGPRPARKVYVLTTDLWTQTLELPMHRSAGASAAELNKALNFEAEAISGQSAFESVVSHVPLPASAEGMQSYWLIQARGADIDLMDDIVRKAGSKLLGVGHPGGLARPPAAGAWQRVELWPDAVVAVRGRAKGPPDVQVFNSDPQMGRWRAEVADWERKEEPADRKELLVAAGVEVPAKTEGQHLTRLDDKADLAAWLAALGDQLTQKRPPLPLLVAAPVPMSVTQRRRIAALGALGALALCCTHYFLYMDRGIQSANAERAKLQAPAARLPDLEKQLKDVEGKEGKLKEEIGKFDRCAAKLAAQRNRLSRLLSSLARHRAEDLLVQRIDNDAGEPKIQGLCLQPELADQFAAWLTRELRPEPGRPDGWEVQPPRKVARNLVADGGPWHFEILCKVPAEPAAVQTASKAPARHR